MYDVESNQQPIASRAVHLVLVSAIGFSVVGFFVGIRQGTPVPTVTQSEGLKPRIYGDAVPAMSYLEFDRRRFGPNRQWQTVLSDLDDRDVPPAEARWSEPFEFESFLSDRAARRAYDGAPPTIPHPIEQMSSASCLACHVESQYIGRKVFAPAMSHDYMANCTQCHVEQKSPNLEPFLFADNTFAGTVRPDRGTRAWSAAPPTLPHPLVMRENCMSCHGPAGAHAIRTDHPWDAVCLQCHIPAVIHDQFARPDTLRRLGILDSMFIELEVQTNDPPVPTAESR